MFVRKSRIFDDTLQRVGVKTLVSSAIISVSIYLAPILLSVLYPSVTVAAPITYTYDSLNRLTTVTYDTGEIISYTYDSTGNRLTLDSTATTIPPPKVTTDDGIFTTSDMQVCWEEYLMVYGNMTAEYAIGSGTGLSDIVDWTEGGRENCVTMEASGLADGSKIYVSLRGKTFNGVLSQPAATDGVIFLRPEYDPDQDGYTNQTEIAAKSDPYNSKSIPGDTSIHLYPGFNLVSIPAEMLYMDTAFKLIPVMGNDQEIKRVLHLNISDDSYEEAAYLPGSVLTGLNFANKNGEGLVVYSKVEKVVPFTSKVCPVWDLSAGVNLVGTPCATGLTAFGLLDKLGGETMVSSIQRYNPDTGRFDTAAYETGQPVGVDFQIKAGEGYFVHMKQNVSGFRP